MQHVNFVRILVPENQMYNDIFDIIREVWLKYSVLDNTSE